jgi:hypothetical protein
VQPAIDPGIDVLAGVIRLFAGVDGFSLAAAE